jgi:tellurite resistance protein TehA-like permease
MATGIIAVAFQGAGATIVAEAFFAFAAGSYLVLLAMTSVRFAKHRERLAADFNNPSRAPAFFTTVAATGVLGVCCVRLFAWAGLALGLWWFALSLWVVLLYAFAATIVTASEKPSLEKSLNGSWLIIVVGAQSVSVLGTLLTEFVPDPGNMIVVSAVFFLTGSALYFLLIAALSLRLFFHPIRPTELTPPYWVMMGAAAISTLAGSELSSHASVWQMQLNAIPVLHGFALFFWVAATGWIPLLLLFGYWRHVAHHVPVTYDPQLWSIVFPLGMYCVASASFVRAFDLGGFAWIPALTLPVAAVAWVLTTVGMVRSAVSRPPQPPYTLDARS